MHDRASPGIEFDPRIPPSITTTTTTTTDTDTTMGGDGGTISSNRTYLRGAGKACHTADHPSNALKRAKLEEAELARLTMTTCAVSGAVLDISPVDKGGGSVGGIGIVACPHGRLYKRENALEALLRRSQGAGDDGKTSPLGNYIRGMKDLYPVRFHVVPTSNGEGGYIAACPITGSEIGNGNIASYLIVRAKSKDKKDKKKSGETDEVEKNPNVLSERALKEMGLDGLQAEYGPFEEKDMIRLAPPKAGGVFDEIRSKWEARIEMEALAKVSLAYSQVS